MFKECSDIDELTDVISSWVSYCKDTVIPIKAVKVYTNSKPWVTKSLKGLLCEKNRAFTEENSKSKDKLETQLSSS